MLHSRYPSGDITRESGFSAAPRSSASLSTVEHRTVRSPHTLWSNSRAFCSIWLREAGMLIQTIRVNGFVKPGKVAPGCLQWWSSIYKTAPGAPHFDAGQEDAALAHLKEHLSWRVQVERLICGGCGQTRGEDTPMLTCSGCHVVRVCSADHQKMASKKAALGGSLLTERHKDISGVLSKVARGCQGRCGA
jgi:hypothetical protein